MSVLAGELPSPESLTLQDDIQTLGAALPLLQNLHRTERRISGRLPDDFPNYSGQSMVLGSYYMNSYDPPTVGTWSLEVGDSLRARVSTTPIKNNDVKFDLTVAGEDGKPRPANGNEVHTVASILGLISESPIEVEKNEKVSLAKRAKHAGGHVLSIFRS